MRSDRLLAAEKCRLLVVDIQEAFAPHIHQMERVIERSRIMIEAAGLLEVPIIVTEQYPKGLGATVEPIREALGDCAYHQKTAFSCWQDQAIQEAILATGRRQILMVGIEGHVCIGQSAHDMLAAGLSCHLAVDAISSRRAADCEAALARVKDAGAFLSTTEAAIMEMTVSSKHRAFREISKLIK